MCYFFKFSRILNNRCTSFFLKVSLWPFVIGAVFVILRHIYGGQQRFSIENARRRIERESAMPKKFMRYTLNGNETGIYSNWYKDEVELQRLTKLLTKGVKFALTNSELRTRECSLVRTVVENFILRVKKRLESVTIKKPGVPWGKNWYGFSVCLTTMLGYYLLLPEAAMSHEAKYLIKLIITNPERSLGYRRSGSNSVYMAGPWILVKLLDGEVNQAANTIEYKNALEFSRMRIRTRRDQEGLHKDRTFIFHGNGIFYEYFRTLTAGVNCDAAKLLYAVDGDARPPTERWQEVAIILYHPSIPYGNIGLFGRLPRLGSGINSQSPYGIKVMPFSGYLRYFTKNAQFSVRAQKAHLAFYESDATSTDFAQYWVQYRCIHRADTSYSVEFPAPGLIAHEADANLTLIPSLKETTTTFSPKKARSFVIAYKNVGLLYQEYEIEQLGNYSVREFIEVDSSSEHIRITIEITNNEAEKSLVYYSPILWDSRDEEIDTRTVVRPGETASISTYMSMNDAREGVRIENPTSAIKFPRWIGNWLIKEYEMEKCFVLFDVNRPVVRAPYEWNYERDTIKMKLNDTGDYTVFTFDSQANQYISTSW